MIRRATIRPRAEADIDHYFHFLCESSEEAAIRFLDGVEQTINAILKNPSAGSPRDLLHPALTNTRSRHVSGFANHLVFYRTEDSGDVVVIRVLHMAMDLPAHFADQDTN